MAGKYGAKAAVANQTLVIAQHHADVRLNCNEEPGIDVPKQPEWSVTMMRRVSFLMIFGLILSACTPEPTSTTVGADGRPLPKLYRIRGNDTAKLQFRMLDSVNALRASQGVGPVELNPQLNAAAATHSRDMSLQNRPWHFGSDGSSPIDRLARVGYTGSLVGENISETYETELETLAAWMEQPDTRRTILAREAAEMGFAWFQEDNGKIWWTMVMGNPNNAPLIPAANPSATRLVPDAQAEEESAVDTEEETVVVTDTPVS